MSGEKDFVIENGVLIRCNRKGGDVVIPDGVTEIGESVFHSSVYMTSVTIPASVVKIGRGAFHCCTGVEEYRVAADNPKYAGDGPLLLGTASKTLIAAGKVEGHITLPDRVNKIGEYAFVDCAGLTGVTIPEGYKSIGNCAFEGCKNLRDVSLPTTISRVGEGAFKSCKNMPFLVWINPDAEKLDNPGIPVLLDAASPSQLPKECLETSVFLFVQQYASGAEMPESRRKNYLDYIRRTRKRWLESAIDDPALLRLLLAEKMIDAKLFPDALAMAQGRNKTEVIAMLLEYQNDASFQTEKKKEENREEARTQRFFESGKLTVSELKKLWSYKNLEDGSLEITKYKGAETDVVIPDVIGKSRVTKIGERAFADCTGLTSVIIPEGVTEIGWNAFSGCTALTSVTIPEGVTNIGSHAFKNCKKLTSITIPAGVTKIDCGTFDGCSGLTSIAIPAGVTQIEWEAFSGCSGLTSITIPDGVTEIGNHAFTGCIGLTAIAIPKGVTTIGKEAFKDCTGLTSITIPDSVTEIGNYAFCNCDGLADEQGLIIAKGIVFGCTGQVADVIIPEGVTTIAEDAFRGCSGLTSVAIPASVTKVDESAFEMCPALKNVVIQGKDTQLVWGSNIRYNTVTYTFHAPAGSRAEDYAKEYDIPFVAE